MKRLIRLFIAAAVIGIPLNSYAGDLDWWVNPPVATQTPTQATSQTVTQAPAENPVDQIQVEKPVDIGEPAPSASRVNWASGYIEVMAGATADQRVMVNYGQAKSVALKTARALAYEKLAETINGISLDSSATYNRELMTDSELKTHVSALIRGARILEEKVSQNPDGSVWAEVTLGIDIRGKGRDTLARPTTDWVLRHRDRLNNDEAYFKLPESDKYEAPLSEEGQTQPSESKEKYTGLIIDARGLNGKPAMLPKIIAENGQIVYGDAKVSPNYLREYGMAGYANSVSQAESQKRIGDNPLIIKAIKAVGSNKTDFVISDNDAARIMAADALGNFLKDCKVSIVLN